MKEAWTWIPSGNSLDAKILNTYVWLEISKHPKWDIPVHLVSFAHKGLNEVNRSIVRL